MKQTEQAEKSMQSELQAGAELDSELQGFAKHFKGKEEAKVELLRQTFSPVIDEIKKLEHEKASLETQAKTIAKQIQEKLEGIRKQWQPFIAGVEKAQIGFDDDTCLVAETILTIGTENGDESSDWFLNNGYKEVMKWQIHDMTKKKIARELYAKGQEIPGLTYQKFLVVKVK